MKRQNFKVLSAATSLSLSLSPSPPCFYFILTLYDATFVIGQGSISYAVGFFLVLIGWPLIGMLVETYGFVLLFRFGWFSPKAIGTCQIKVLLVANEDNMQICSGFWPTLVVFLQRLPFLGWVFRQPFVTSVRLTKLSFIVSWLHYLSIFIFGWKYNESLNTKAHKKRGFSFENMKYLHFSIHQEIFHIQS